MTAFNKYIVNGVLASGVLALGLVTAGLAWAEGVVLRSTEPLPGYTAADQGGYYEKIVDVDPDMAARMKEWTMRIETQSKPGLGFAYDSDSRKYTKYTIIPYNALTDGPKYCSHVDWSDTKQSGYQMDEGSGRFFKVLVLTIAEAREQGRY